MVTKVQIVSKLREIERKEGVKILYAVESGSRGWGFESKDSDYDVRFIYVHPLDWYLSIEEGRDVIEHPVAANLDISGWDLKKALVLFKKSNPPLYEWLTSPTDYIEKEDFTQRLRSLMPEFYSPVSSLHHYLHMAYGNYKAYLNKQKVRIKKYFYVLRPIFACMWIEAYHTMPPMEFQRLLDTLKLNEELRIEIYKLLDRKRSGAELDQENKILIVDKFLRNKIQYFENYAKNLKSKKHPDIKILDKLFTEVVKDQG